MIPITYNHKPVVERREITTLPQFLRDLISCPPKAGDGVHAWLFKLARQLHAHRTPEEATELLSAAVEGCGRIVPHREIIDAVEASMACAWQPGQHRSKTTGKTSGGWPVVNTKAREAAITKEPAVRLADLWEASPWRCDEGTDAEHYLDILFPGNPLLCLGRDMSNFRTAPRVNFRGNAAANSLIVPSPMTSIWGLTKTGQRSMHTLASTGPRRYLVTEFDNATFDEQAAIIDHLSEYAPLAMVLSSGGKSLHAWWPCAGCTNDWLVRFFSYAVSLTSTPCPPGTESLTVAFATASSTCMLSGVIFR